MTPGRYRTAGGLVAHVIARTPEAHYCWSGTVAGRPARWNARGEHSPIVGDASRLDLVQPEPDARRHNRFKTARP